MVTTIQWRKGSGFITATYNGSGNGTCTITSDPNDGEAREQIIHVSAGSLVCEIVIRQEAYPDQSMSMRLVSSDRLNLVSSDNLTLNVKE